MARIDKSDLVREEDGVFTLRLNGGIGNQNPMCLRDVWIHADDVVEVLEGAKERGSS